MGAAAVVMILVLSSWLGQQWKLHNQQPCHPNMGQQYGDGVTLSSWLGQGQLHHHHEQQHNQLPCFPDWVTSSLTALLLSIYDQGQSTRPGCKNKLTSTEKSICSLIHNPKEIVFTIKFTLYIF
jgi:hypothetical protein